MSAMTTKEPITAELQARIDALPDENLKANILRFLSRPRQRTKPNEQIFEEMLADYEEVMAERAKWRQWRDDEVLAFSTHFKQQMPEDYAEYIRQEIENGAIDANLSWKVEQLSQRWLPGLAPIDYILLLGKVRDHLQAQLRLNQEGRP
jgi:hypothetical protein